MSDIFISYARSTEPEAERIAQALRALGHKVWRDDDLPAHRAYAEVIEERLRAAKAVLVVWSQDAAKSQWVRAEANVAREAGTLVQLRIDAAMPPLPFNEIQCADLAAWNGETDAPGWLKVLSSVEDLVGGRGPAPERSAHSPAPAQQRSRPSIAVMPFATAGDDPDQAYFSEGVMEEIVANLTRFRQLFVIGGESTRALQNARLGPQDVGRKLGVRYVLEGGVRKSAERVRIAVKLVDAADGAQVWAHRYDDTLEDVFALQDRVANAVAAVIEPALEEAEIKRVSRRPTDRMDAYDLYLHAVHLQRSYQKAARDQAQALLERALELDPHFAVALARLAFIHAIAVITDELEGLESRRCKALDLADRALRAGADDALALALTALALSAADPTPDRALQLAERAVQLNPASPNVLFHSGAAAMACGDADTGLSRFEALERLAPQSVVTVASRFWIGVAWFVQGRFADALAELRQSPHPRALDYAVLASIHGHLGQCAEARDMLEKFRAVARRPVEHALDILRRPEHRKVFLDGIALAEGKAVERA
jgi:adenylate cyclase